MTGVQTCALPILLDKPVVQYIVEEMAASGITEIIFITSSQKRPIEDHFDRNDDFENFKRKQFAILALPI